ncbi:MAG: transcriptional regulator TenI [Paenibacillaceae bacterium]|jgi:thiazole tautomerase (transcriptional regulator TenI)|nr:transcriptional regulator TenI [Paenibacillaceae bacterium]
MSTTEIHLISGPLDNGHFLAVASRVHHLLDYIHLRDKDATAGRLVQLAESLLDRGVPAPKLIINDRVDAALCAGAGGVQLAWHSLRPGPVKSRWPDLRVGCSVHSAQEAEEAFAQGADYVLFGHIYPSSSKPGLPGRGLGALQETVSRSCGPVIALGGILPGHVPAILRQGAAGFAVLSGIGSASDPVAAAWSYRRAAGRSALGPHGENADDPNRPAPE